MSHFAVLVIGDDYEEQLQPYHEYECTGVKDQFVEFVDCTDEVTTGWGVDEVNLALDEDGKKVSAYHNDAVDGTEFTVPVHEHYVTIEEYAEKYHGYDLIDGKFGRWTNPNAKWDWYCVGGRWTGYFKVKEGADYDIGTPGIMTEEAKDGWADRLRKQDIDIEGMRENARVGAEKDYDEFEATVLGYARPPWACWEDVREAHDDIEDAREEYNNHPYVKAIKEAHIGPWMDCALEYFCVFTGGREKFVENAMNLVAVPFAVVKNGEWYQKGEMGWWGTSINEMDQDDWNKQFQKLINDVPGDTIITAVDCHI